MNPNFTQSDIGNLPSNFYPYSWKSLSIRPFSVAEFKLISRSVVLGSRAPLVQAVGATINVPINDVTIGDFYYLLAWHKQFSLPRKPWILTWRCPDSYLQHKTTGAVILNHADAQQPEGFQPADYKLVPCGRSNTVPVHQNNLSVIQLPENDPIVLPEGFDWPRVGILDELHAALSDPDMNMLAGATQWIAGNTWEEKVAALDARGMDFFFQAQALNDSITFGIAEYVEAACLQCGALHRHDIELDPITFFR